MSHGRLFIQSAIAEQQPAVLRRALPEYFLEEEMPLFEYVLAHHNRFGVMPGEGQLRENGFRLSPFESDQPIAYHLQRLQHRFIFNVVNDGLPEITNGMQAQDMDAVIDTFRHVLARAGNALQQNAATELSDEVQHVIDDYEYARRNPGLRGITLGLPTLDMLTLGAQPGDLIVTAGRPSLGKTNLLINSAYGAWLLHHRLLVISMEMQKLQITRRWVGRHTGLNPNLIRAGHLSQWGDQLLREGAQQITDAAGRVFLETGDYTRQVGGVEEMIEQFQPEAVYIDAAYLLSPEGVKKGYISRWESISEVVGQLKQLAMKYGIPIFITVQFNRNQKTNSTKNPDLGDIAGTDAIPQDASIVLGIQKAPAPYGDVRRLIHMMKSREGEVATVVINYLFEPVDFTEIQEEEEEQEQQVHVVNLEWMVSILILLGITLVTTLG